jgi:hypothetical protein
LKLWYDPADLNTRRWTWWRLFEGYGSAARTYAFAARTGRLPATALDSAYLTACDAEIVAAGDDIARFSEQSAYGTSFADLNKSYRSAGWYFSTERAFELAVADQIEAKPGYLEAVLYNVNYEGGANPVNIPYITGLGWERWREIVHQYAQNDYQALPPSGIPLGNIQAGFAYLENYKYSLGQLSYPPDGANTAPYPFYDRWGDSFNTTTEFVVVDQSRSLGTLAFLMAKTDMANAPYNRAATSISGLPRSVPAEQSITATFAAAGVDITGARILWEARDQQPYIGSTFTFSAKNPGQQWVEAEALLPDGRRLFCKTNFTAVSSSSLPPNSFQSTPVSVTAEAAAIYHLDESLSDATEKNGPLILSGNARFSDVNLGWMESRSGRALRFEDLGDKASVSIPAAVLYGGGTAVIAVEAMVFVESYKGWNRGTARLLSLERSWNASLKWFEDMYSGPHVSGGTSFDCTGATLAGALPKGEWHHLSIALSSSGYTLRVNGVVIATVAASDLSGWSGGAAVLEFGNFSGWIDEVVIRSSTASSEPAPTPVPTTPLLPNCPSDISCLAQSSTEVRIQWSDTSTNETGFQLLRKAGASGTYITLLAEADATSYTDRALIAGTEYFYKLNAYNSAGSSPQSPEISVITPAAQVPGGPGTSVLFVQDDTTTQGSWRGAYGTDGAIAAHSGFTHPTYVQLTTHFNPSHTWENPSTNPLALQRLTGAERFATYYRSTRPMYFDFDFKDAETHRISFYFAEFDALGRQQKLEFFDRATGRLLAEKTIANFQNSLYSTWHLRGKVRAKVTKINGRDALLNGIFFDPTPPNAVRYLGADTTRGGTWIGAIGAQGFQIASETAQLPAATVSSTGKSDHIWNWTTPDTAALQRSTGTDRLAACWYSSGSFEIRVNITDGQAHKLRFYCLDWDMAGRTQKVEALDAGTGAVLHSSNLASFQRGAYLAYDIKGNVIFRFTRTGPLNAVVSGLFLDPASSPF